jgi:hypothetical protein
MTAFLDARIPVLFDCCPDDVRPDDAWLVEGAEQPQGDPVMARFTADEVHTSGCVCCSGRSDAARALSSLFLDRARGKTAFFRRVVLLSRTPTGEQHVRDALGQDVLVSQWFRKA